MQVAWLAALVLATSPVGASRAGSAVTRLEGAAIVRGAGRLKFDGVRDWREATTADVLTPGITVRAAADQPLEMTLPDGVIVTLEPNALARWMPGGKLPSETNHWTRGYHLALEDGELEVRMPPCPKGAHAFLVSTSAGTLTDWRGQLHVRVSGDTAAATIYEGALVAGSNGQGFPVYDGAGVVIRRGARPEKTREIPACPQWDSAESGLSLSSSGAGAPTSVDLAWQPVAHAVEYRIEVALDPTMLRVVERARAPKPRFTANLPPGKPYWVHVRAVGAEGIVGPWSMSRPINALRYELPEGAFVARDGVVVVPEGGIVSVPNGEAMQVAYEDVTTLSQGLAGNELRWSSLKSGLRLSHNARMRIVHLRDPNTGSEARLVLARRELRADVALAPALARGSAAREPTDPVDARVEVRDPSGRIDVSEEPVTVETLLDSTPLEVAWRHEGATWLGRIAPRLVADSVIHIIVRDGQGIEIGSGFLELGSP